MEYFDILNEDGSKNGKQKLREEVHRDGDLHGAARIWLFRINPANRKQEVLLQKRSKNKDAYPGVYDVSAAGHVSAGEDFFSTAQRELEEELGYKCRPDQLHFLFFQRVDCDEIFWGRRFLDRELHAVYLAECKWNESEFTIQEEEVDKIIWRAYEDVLDELLAGKQGYCLNLKEFRRLYDYLQLYTGGKNEVSV